MEVFSVPIFFFYKDLRFTIRYMQRKVIWNKIYNNTYE